MSSSKRHPNDQRLTHDSSRTGSELQSLTTPEQTDPVEIEMDAEGDLDQDGGRSETDQVELSDLARSQQTQQLISEHHPTVYRYAYWLTGCQATAEDITQDVFIRAFRGIHNLRSQEAAKSWLMTITRNEFARWCQKRVPTPVEEIDDSRERDDHQLQALENTEWVRQALLELPDDFRVIVLMFYFEQSSYAEIAAQLDIPMGTVMSRLSRGKKQLRSALDRLAEPPTKSSTPTKPPTTNR